MFDVSLCFSGYIVSKILIGFNILLNIIIDEMSSLKTYFSLTSEPPYLSIQSAI